MSEYLREFWFPLVASVVFVVALLIVFAMALRSDRMLAECERAMALYVALVEIPVTTQQHGARLDAVRAKVHECLGEQGAR